MHEREPAEAVAAAGLGAMSRRSAAASPVCPVDDLPSGLAKQVGRRAFSHVAGAWILGIAAQVAEAAYDIGQTEEISDRERRILDAIRGVLNA